jgi:hypothetical protein
LHIRSWPHTHMLRCMPRCMLTRASTCTHIYYTGPCEGDQDEV